VGGCANLTRMCARRFD